MGRSVKVVEMKSKAQRKPTVVDDPAFAQAVQNYQAGLKAMQEHKFERAKALFEKAMEGPSKELADRARTHLHGCNQYLSKATASFESPEERYDYAVSLINAGDYEQARQQLEQLQKKQPQADYVFYGLAVLDCVTGRTEDCLRNLAEAIRRNGRNRIHARNDGDFETLADDPRFTELLYPEPESSPATR